MVLGWLFGILLAVACDAYKHRLRGTLRPRVYQGFEDTSNKYPYVVSILYQHSQTCTGCLISASWVLAAAHCDHSTAIQYGNNTIPTTARYRKIIKIIQHPGFRIFTNSKNNQVDKIYNDIALMQITPVLALNTFGVISALEYESLFGFPVEYAGFGLTGREAWGENEEHNQNKPLQLGEGVISSCSHFNRDGGPFLCVTPKCGNYHQFTLQGDSGGPLFYEGKIVGVLTGGEPPTSVFTAVSPYLAWIQDIMT